MSSSIFDKLVDKGVSVASKELEKGKWVESAVSAAKKQTDSLGEAKPAVDAALDTMLANKDVLGHVSSTAFVAIVGHLALGQEDQARLLYLAKDASFDEMMAALDQSDAAARKAKADKDAAWAATKKVALEVLVAAGKAALPLLLAAI